MTDMRTRNAPIAAAIINTLDTAAQILADRGHTRNPQGTEGRLDIWSAICKASPDNYRAARLAKAAVEETAGDLYRWEKDRADRDATDEAVALMGQAKNWFRDYYEKTGWVS
jgi:hypothetical protein